MVVKMTMSASVADARSIPRVLTDNLFVEKQPCLTDAQMHGAMGTWLNVEDDPQVLEDDIELELQAVEEELGRAVGGEYDQEPRESAVSCTLLASTSVVQSSPL